MELFVFAVSLALPIVTRIGTVGLPTIFAFLRSQLLFVPPALNALLYNRFKNYQTEHIWRHASYALSSSLTIFGVDFDRVEHSHTIAVYYIASQLGLFLFVATHVLEYKGVSSLRTHYGDTPALSFLLLASGMLVQDLQDLPDVFVFTRSVLIAVPLRVALSTLFLIAHAEFAQHATTRAEHPAFAKCSRAGMFLASLYLALVEVECTFDAFAFFPVVASTFAMFLDVQTPLASPRWRDVVIPLLAAPVALGTSHVLYGEDFVRVGCLGCTSLLLFSVVGRTFLDDRMHLPSALLSWFAIIFVGEAWSTAGSLALRASAWAVVNSAVFWSIWVCPTLERSPPTK